MEVRGESVSGRSTGEGGRGVLAAADIEQSIVSLSLAARPFPLLLRGDLGMDRKIMQIFQLS